MKEVRNLDGQKICTIDPEVKTVVIVIKGVETIIRFKDDGTYDIKHTILDTLCEKLIFNITERSNDPMILGRVIRNDHLSNTYKDR